MIRLWKERRLFSLFLTIVFFLVAFPLIKEDRALRGDLLNAYYVFVLISGVYAVSRNRAHVRVSLFFAVPALIALGLSTFLEETLGVILFALVAMILFNTYVTVVLLRSLLRKLEIDTEIIYGTVAVYFLIGISYAMLHAIIELLHPGAYSFSSSFVPGTSDPFAEIVYFSMVTLTTLGFGDVTPTIAVAKTLTYMEAATGVLYLAVIISRFVGVYVAQEMERKR